MPDTPRLRDAKKNTAPTLYPLGEIPLQYLAKMGKTLTYFYAIGRKDITGDDWGDVFSSAIGGSHFASPVGIVDVAYNKMAWSTKTIKNPKPHACATVRLVSGRNSPDYSYGIKNPHADVQKTGDAILGIWNARVDIAKKEYNSLREAVLIRNPEEQAFTYCESEIVQFSPSEYEWIENTRGNLEGFRKSDALHTFTWQPHGAQFTIIQQAPPSAAKFKLRQVPLIDIDTTLVGIGFQEDWITFE